MALLPIVQAAESVGIVVVGLLAAYWLMRNAHRLNNGKRGLRYTKALICILMAGVYLATLLNWLDAVTLSIYARPLLLMLLMSLLGREWLERMP